MRNMWDVEQLTKQELAEAYTTALRFVKCGLMNETRSASAMLNSDNFLTRVKGFHMSVYLKCKKQ
tara:strand:+ start:728 stop:922 length:195 start_codon:yes stop_codon:yes gene_type:complete